MKIKTQYIAALVLAVGGTMTAWAGPGVGPYGPWNSGGAFGGFGPYQPYVVRGCPVQEGLSTRTVFLKRATCSSPVRTRTFITPAPVVAETILEAPAPVAERVIIRKRCVQPLRTTRVITSERIVRPATFSRLTTRCIPRRNLEVVGERIITSEPVVERVVTPAPVMELAPSCPVSADWDYANPYQ
jgi:hypothetical protein